MSNKERAAEIYAKHIALASTDGRGFRKTVMEEIMATCGCTEAAAATFYNNAKKAMPVEGLGRAPVAPGVRKPSNGKTKTDDLLPDNECFSVLELLPRQGRNFDVGRCQSFSTHEMASEKYNEKVKYRPENYWVLIQGLGPNSGDIYRLETGEKELKRHAPYKEKMAA